MLLAGPYNKTRSVTQKNKYIARFFPSRLATVVKIYLALVRPMELVTSAQLFGVQSQQVYRYYLFVRRGHLYTGERVRKSRDFRIVVLTFS